MHFLRLFTPQKIGLYCLLLGLILPTLVQAESACENPSFPGCQSPRGPNKPLKIAIMIDESGSVTNEQQERIRQATLAYATKLAEKATSTRQVEFAVYSFSNLVRTVLPSIDVKGGTFKSRLNVIKSLRFRGGATRFSKALESLQTRNT
ncbi:MAG: VWA domain-containing protein, partial [Cyanothece sp. SIO1E1]|nr:VWA domain-containing protein [Cyanothece sp. SIO1E1]